jgi:hypothetical protein
MALSANDLVNDIMNDSAIVGPIPQDAIPQFTVFIQRLSLHITEQIKRGSIDDVTVNTSSGNQTNVSNVK